MGVYAVTGGSNGIGAKTISILKQKGDVYKRQTIQGADCVNISYPRFYEELMGLIQKRGVC